MREISDLERAVRRGAVVNKMRRLFRRKALSRPIPGWWLRTTHRDTRRINFGDKT